MAGSFPRLFIMSELKQIGIPIKLDIERNLIFNLNVIEKCVDKFGAMDDILNAAELGTVKWLAVQMINEAADIWNDDHPNDQKPYIDEAKLGRYLIGINSVNELQKKVQEAMFLGLPSEQVKEVKDISKNLMTAQVMNGKMGRLRRRFRKK